MRITAGIGQVETESGDSSHSEITTVRQSESTLNDVANRLGVSLESLQRANPQVNPNALKAGQDICLPQPETQESDSTDSAGDAQSPGNPASAGTKFPGELSGDLEKVNFIGRDRLANLTVAPDHDPLRR